MSVDLGWLPHDHPLRGSVAELLATPTRARWAPIRLRSVQSWLAYLADAGTDPLCPSTRQVEEWLPADSPSLRAQSLQSVRSLYREALAKGVVASDPTRGIHRHRALSRVEHRLSDDQVRHLLAVTLEGAGHPAWHLAARRDVLLLLLLVWRKWSLDALSRLTWGHVEEGQVCVDVTAPTPRCVAGAVDEFRAQLRDYGVEPVAADALLPVLGRRIEWSWRAAERPLLAHLSTSALHQIVKRRTGAAGLRVPAGRVHVAPKIWLHRDGRDLDHVLMQADTRLLTPTTTVPTLPGRGLGVG